jgi:hypothetical protein
MLLRRKKHRTHGEDRLLALTPASTAGVLNVMAFGGSGFFSSHMTGNTSRLSGGRGRLTHVTGTLTDAGMAGLAGLLILTATGGIARVLHLTGRRFGYRPAYSETAVTCRQTHPTLYPRGRRPAAAVSEAQLSGNAALRGSTC